MNLLTALRTAGGQYKSGADFAQAAGLSRAAIWKQVEELRARGYEIEARRHQGYRLVSAPDLPYAEEIWNGLSTRVFGREAVYLASTSSTNDQVRMLGQQGRPEGTLVVAERQTSGRGRLAVHGPHRRVACGSVCSSNPAWLSRISAL